MKKIVLGCATVLLSLGLLAGCNNDTDSAVTISVDNTATVVVGETLELPYTVEPEKAKVEVLNDHEEYVTATAKKGVLSLEGIAEGSTTITLVGTYKKYTEANVDIKVSVVTEKDVDTEPGIEGPTTYKLGAVDTTEYVYRWFNGSVSNNLSTTDNWEEAVDVYITAIDDDIDNTCTLSFYDGNGDLKYIKATSDATGTSLDDEPCTWYWNEEYQLFALGTTVGGNSSQDRGLAYYQSSHDIRAYATTASNLTTYSWVNAYTEKPAEPEIPETPELTQVTSLTNGESYYFGAESNGVYHLITGSISSYELAVTNDFSSAVQVTATGNDNDGWKLTIGDKYIYVMLYTQTSGSSKLEIDLSDAETVPSSGVNLFSWSSTNNTVYQESVYSSDSYKCVYFEYYNNLVQPYGADAETSTFSNAAHFYQVAEEAD